MGKNKHIIDYDKINFNDRDDYAPDTQICMSCGSESDERIGYNEERDLLKCACSNCGIVYVEDVIGEIVLLKGEYRFWDKFLRSHLLVPFAAVVDSASDEEIFGFGKIGPIRYKDELTVISVVNEDVIYGIMVNVEKGKMNYTYPLCDLKVSDPKSPNYKLVDDYRTWFANCR